MIEHKELVDRLEYVVEQLRLRAKFRDEYATPFDPNLDNEAARVIEEQAAKLAKLAEMLIMRPIVHSTPAQGYDLDAMVAHFQTTPLYLWGDAKLRWVSEADIVMHDVLISRLTHPPETDS